MEMRKSKIDQAVEGICIILSSISKATAFLHQGVTTCGFRELVRYNLNRKCLQFMLIGFRQRLSILPDTLELSLDNVPIEHVSSAKSLGIYIDEYLKWNFHIDNLCRKMASAIASIIPVKSFVDQSTLVSTYNSLVQSHFHSHFYYCSPV